MSPVRALLVATRAAFCAPLSSWQNVNHGPYASNQLCTQETTTRELTCPYTCVHPQVVLTAKAGTQNMVPSSSCANKFQLADAAISSPYLVEQNQFQASSRQAAPTAAAGAKRLTSDRQSMAQLKLQRGQRTISVKVDDLNNQVRQLI